jgi:hypothetical protein
MKETGLDLPKDCHYLIEDVLKRPIEF